MNEPQPASLPAAETQGGAGKNRRRRVIWIIGCAMLVNALLLGMVLLDASAKAKHRAQSITCLSKLKQIDLAAIIWAHKHAEVFPKDFLTMSNELTTPKLLLCPADRSKMRASDWSQYHAVSNVSYEFVRPEIVASGVSTQVVFRCPIHKHVALVDGSVHWGQP